MTLFEDFLQILSEDLKTLAEEYGRDYSRVLLKAGTDFARETRTDLERWARLLASGQLTEADFKWLLKGKKDLMEMELLKQEGLSMAHKDRLQQALINTIAGAVIKTLQAG